MTRSPPIPRRTAIASLLAPLLPALLQGCVSEQDKGDAIHRVNEAFRIEYERLVAEKGTRTYRQKRGDAFLAMRVTLAGLGMRTEQQDLSLGHLAVAGKAPLPLSDDEWRSASEADLPLLRRAITPAVGIVANFVGFEPQGLEVVINATFLDAPEGTEVSLTVRLREIAPPRSGWPRREYVGPHVLEVGIAKIFGAFERELRAGPAP